MNVVVRQRPEKHVQLRALPRPRLDSTRHRGRPGRSENLEVRDEVKIRRLDDLWVAGRPRRVAQIKRLVRLLPIKADLALKPPTSKKTHQDAQGW